ncbi:DUF2933 domain-containing protein [Mycolicibacterium grossiae]|uniref:DUF2933 domain-containing protein n=1 Tax=Mycolicibacterium grossiae TaxID=1552759 RepID=UPI000F7A28C4|nr:DUF2933 domain-containing protein [Mycolicibacterium grossiae]
MKCYNKNVLIGMAVIALAVFVLKPSWMLAALPLLLLAACPLVMVFMMRAMSGKSGGEGSSDVGTATGAPAQEDLNREIRFDGEELRAPRIATTHRTAPEATTTNHHVQAPSAIHVQRP